jgi:hypothetical protein
MAGVTLRIAPSEIMALALAQEGVEIDATPTMVRKCRRRCWQMKREQYTPPPPMRVKESNERSNPN